VPRAMTKPLTIFLSNVMLNLLSCEFIDSINSYSIK